MKDDAGRAMMLFAVDPVGLGGIALRAGAGPARDAWLAGLRDTLPADSPIRRVPLHIGDERLLGGIDLTATLGAGRVVAQRGVLAECDGGVVLLAMAERLAPTTAAQIAAVMDTKECVTERDGVSSRTPCRVGVVALDEGIADDERVSSRLLERLAFHVELDERRNAEPDPDPEPDPASVALADRARVTAARESLRHAQAPDDIVEALCAAALALGVASMRAPLLAVKAALASAALDGRDRADEKDAALAARLVLGPRATQLPPPSEGDESSEARGEADQDEQASDDTHPTPPDQLADSQPPAGEVQDGKPDRSDEDDLGEPVEKLGKDALDEVVLEAAMASIPQHLLASLAGSLGRAARRATAGRAGAMQAGKLRGRPCGARREEPRGQTRINIIETLRAAAPWQVVRRRERGNAELSQASRRPQGASPEALRGVTEKELRADLRRTLPASQASPSIIVRREDFHVTRFKQRSETTTVFVVDASGSAALHRLAETKGAVELLLADCYVRRDSVAVIAFRGKAAELLLPPTRSLVRAKRSLAALPGGGGTPLAAGIDAAAVLTEAIARKGSTPIVVLLTDGRANIARSGAPGRALALSDALASASRLRLSGVATLLMDTSAQPQESAREMARALGAMYMPLPHAAAPALSRAVREVAGSLADRSSS